MEARYAFRKSQLLDECQVAPEIFEQVIPRLYTFMKPFVTIFQGQVAEQHAKTYVCGLLSNLARKNIESIAYRFGHSRLPLPGRADGYPSGPPTDPYVRNERIRFLKQSCCCPWCSPLACRAQGW